MPVTEARIRSGPGKLHFAPGPQFCSNVTVFKDVRRGWCLGE
jgi:hypothetical protein